MCQIWGCVYFYYLPREVINRMKSSTIPNIYAICDESLKKTHSDCKNCIWEYSKDSNNKKHISIELRSLIANCYIWSTLLYGAETWTPTKVTSDKLEAFEMWLYRRMLRISRREHKTNGEVLHKMKTKRSLLNTIKKKEMSIFWTYNKRKWGTMIADGRKDKW